jgi:hypothetical protein
VTDEPGFGWRAGLRVPDGLVDVSVKQLDQGRIARVDLERAARAPGACALLVTSDERFGRYAGLPGRLADAGYELAWRDTDGDIDDDTDGERRLYLRPCVLAS